jgi:alcohol dehydrogenase class IV
MALSRDFTWQDGDRTIRFGRGALGEATDILRSGYVLLTTPRGRELAPNVVDAADEVHDIPDGYVETLADDVVERLGVTDATLVVGLGGGRVIDTAKAVAAATGRDAAAIPTTLSAAEMTWVHRRAASHPDSPATRPKIVINDPAISASQPPGDLAASSANALAHAVEGPLTVRTSPVPALVGREAARILHVAWRDESAPDRDLLALGALLSGYSIDGAWYGLSHVCSQTLVRVGPVPHGPANAVVLPHTTAALRSRFPVAVDALDSVLDDESAETFAARLAGLAGASRIRDLGVPEDRLDACADAAADRPELELTPPRATREELRAIYGAAW